MKKAVLIGGSNGIGLAIAKNLTENGYFAEILDLRAPEEGVLAADKFAYHACNLLDLNTDEMLQYAQDPDCSLLMITAGFGRVADFGAHHTASGAMRPSTAASWARSRV